MDREQEEIQFLGFFGILKESCNILTSWTKIFAQITLSMIVPLASIYLAHIEISDLLFTDIMRSEYVLDRTPAGTSAYNRISDVLSSELATFALFKIGYLIFFLVLALLSTSAVVYTIACIYTGKEITFRRVMSVVPKVWKKLMVTFVWSFVIVFAYNAASLLVAILGALVLMAAPEAVVVVFLVIFLVAFFIGLVYITLIWQLASVVSVLEGSYGLAAMAKSKALIRGKMGISIAVFLVLGLCGFGIQLAFELRVVLTDGDRSVGARICDGIVCVVLLSAVLLFGLVAQTIVYFVCKSYHHENIDKSTLSDHLGVYLGEYVPLKSKDVQLEHLEV